MLAEGIPGKIIPISATDRKTLCRQVSDLFHLIGYDSLGRNTGFVVLTTSGSVFITAESPVSWPLAESYSQLLLGEHRLVGVNGSSISTSIAMLLKKYCKMAYSGHSVGVYRFLLAFDVSKSIMDACILDASYNAEDARVRLNRQYGNMREDGDLVRDKSIAAGQKNPFDFEVA